MNEVRATNPITDFIQKNLWALIIVTASVIAQWAVFSVRLQNIEARQDRQGTVITALQDQMRDTQTQYAALNAKVDAVNDNVLYIRERIDKTLNK